MRIIAGKHKGRKINIPSSRSVRPTRPMVREAIFSILSSGEFVDDSGNMAIENAVVLDLFSGSGSFAMEALSRGASKVILIDNDKDNLNIARANLESINELENAYFIGCDVEKLSKAKNSVDIIFIDPPYQKNMVITAINRLTSNDWLKNGTIIIIETDIRDLFELSTNFQLLTQKIYGSTKITFYRFAL